MGRKTRSKGLVRAETAHDEEIIEAPALTSIENSGGVMSDASSDSEGDEEMELERRLVEEAHQKENAADNKAIYNAEAMRALADSWYSEHPKANKKQKLPWVETLDTSTEVLDMDEKTVNDDLKREVAFYNQALASVRAAKEKLHQQNIAYKRPEDYFAEMLKSDKHMGRVKDHLIHEQKKISAVDDRKKSQAHKRVAKELQAEKVKQRAQQKKDTLEAVKQWKKRKATKQGVAEDDDSQIEKLINNPKKQKTGKEVNKRREGKNKKYGFGGPKRNMKQNTRESTNDIGRGRKFKGGKPAGKGVKVAGKGAKRPGKEKRAAQRGRGKK